MEAPFSLLAEGDAGLAQRRCSALRAVTDAVVPPDAVSPGGADGGAVDFILRGLAFGGPLADLLPEYRELLDALNTAAVRLEAMDYAALDGPRGFELLQAIERGRPLPGDEPSDAECFERRRAFFDRLVEHVQEGYYTNPANWASIGFVVTG